MINSTSFSGPLLKRYLELNGIRDAYVWRESARHWQVMEGNAENLTGFLAGEFRTKREAENLKDKINKLIHEAKRV